MAINYRGHNLIGCPGTHEWIYPEKGNGRERAMMILCVPSSFHIVEKLPPHTRVSLEFMEEGGKLNTRETDMQLLCLGPG